MTQSQSRQLLRALLGICHVVLISAAATCALALAQAWPIVAVLAIVPLLFAAKGLYLDSGRTYQWLSLVLVLYIGIGSVEVIASQRETTSAIAVMMAALAELLLLMSLIRNAPPAPH
jgi:uncharacterized membrane protein